jgi:hypothetical protein
VLNAGRKTVSLCFLKHNFFGWSTVVKNKTSTMRILDGVHVAEKESWT